MTRVRNILAVVAVGLALAACNSKPSAPAAGDEMSMGDPKAPVTIIEYASVACTACAAFNNQVFDEVKTKYIDTGKVRWVVREANTHNPTMAAAGFLLARCAGEDKYFQVSDAIYRNQPDIEANIREGLLEIAKSVGMSEKQFEICITDPVAIDAFNERVDRLAREINLPSTPTFVVNGKIVATGAIPFDQMEQVIAQAMPAQATPASTPPTAK